MRATFLISVLVLCSCGQSKSPVGPQAIEDGGEVASCDSITPKSTEIYEQAAVDEAIAAELKEEFVEANVHMVMVDCKANPESVVACVTAATSAADVETKCLAPLDDAGEVEGKQFSKK